MTQAEAEGCIIEGHGVLIFCPNCKVGGVFQFNDPTLSDQIRNALLEKRNHFNTIQLPPDEGYPLGLHPTGKTFEPNHHFVVE